MKEIFNIPKEAETRLWNKYMRNKFELLGNKQTTVQDVGLYQGQVTIFTVCHYIFVHSYVQCLNYCTVYKQNSNLK